MTQILVSVFYFLLGLLTLLWIVLVLVARHVRRWNTWCPYCGHESGKRINLFPVCPACGRNRR